MDLHFYLGFVAIALVVTLVPGADFAVTVKNTLAGGRRRGMATSLGIGSSNAVQGLAAVAGLGALIASSQPVFEAIKWIGVAYLCFLGVQALRSAWRGESAVDADRASAARGFRQGFVSNVTNPKVLVFYLAVLPQFMGTDPGVATLVLLAVTHAVLSTAYLLALVLGIDTARAWLSRRAVRRVLDAVTGVVLLGFAGRLATEA